MVDCCIILGVIKDVTSLNFWGMSGDALRNLFVFDLVLYYFVFDLVLYLVNQWPWSQLPCRKTLYYRFRPAKWPVFKIGVCSPPYPLKLRPWGSYTYNFSQRGWGLLTFVVNSDRVSGMVLDCDATFFSNTIYSRSGLKIASLALFQKNIFGSTSKNNLAILFWYPCGHFQLQSPFYMKDDVVKCCNVR